jgi:hypothetical protein
MENENNEEIEKGEGEGTTPPEEKVIERQPETPEARLARMERQTEQLRKKLGKEAPTKHETQKSSLDEFNEGQLAYLAAKGIESDDDIDFTLGELKKHGGNLRELLGNEYFKSAVKTRNEAKSVLDATPTSTRKGNNAVDSVDYNLSKYLSTGKLPADREMANKVVNARLKQEKSKTMFSDTPVIGV